MRVIPRTGKIQLARETIDTAQADICSRTDLEVMQSSSAEMASPAAVLTRVTATVELQEQVEIVDDACGSWSSEPVVRTSFVPNYPPSQITAPNGTRQHK